MRNLATAGLQSYIWDAARAVINAAAATCPNLESLHISENPMLWYRNPIQSERAKEYDRMPHGTSTFPNLRHFGYYLPTGSSGTDCAPYLEFIKGHPNLTSIVVPFPRYKRSGGSKELRVISEICQNLPKVKALSLPTAKTYGNDNILALEFWRSLISEHGSSIYAIVMYVIVRENSYIYQTNPVLISTLSSSDYVHD